MHGFTKKQLLHGSLENIFRTASEIEKFPKFVPDYHVELIAQWADQKVLNIITSINGVPKEITVVNSVDRNKRRVICNQVQSSADTKKGHSNFFVINYTEWNFREISPQKVLLEAKFIFDIQKPFFQKLMLEHWLLPFFTVKGLSKLFHAIESQALALS
jgi:ribosome-associated toxin RatA of RatAB toxin-antitoxin module